MNTPLQEILTDLNVSIMEVVSLDGCWAHPCDRLVELIEDGWEDEALIESGIPKDTIEELAKNMDRDMLSDELANNEITGFLVRCATPIPMSVRMEGESLSCGAYSWGHMQTKWFYVEEVHHLVSILPEWQYGVLEKVFKEENDHEQQPRAGK